MFLCKDGPSAQVTSKCYCDNLWWLLPRLAPHRDGAEPPALAQPAWGCHPRHCLGHRLAAGTSRGCGAQGPPAMSPPPEEHHFGAGSSTRQTWSSWNLLQHGAGQPCRSCPAVLSAHPGLVTDARSGSHRVCARCPVPSRLQQPPRATGAAAHSCCAGPSSAARTPGTHISHHCSHSPDPL